jgi:hypothetical protein
VTRQIAICRDEGLTMRVSVTLCGCALFDLVDDVFGVPVVGEHLIQTVNFKMEFEPGTVSRKSRDIWLLPC